MSRVLAIDWSGDLKRGRRRIWLCEVVDGEVRRLEDGRSRDEIAEHLIAEAERDPLFVVGLDFAFSFPAQFLRKRAHRHVASVWAEAERLGERWLQHCPFPFWGKPGKRKPALGLALYRETELDAAWESRAQPMSVFQIGGAGAVGVGSIRGMPVLSRLRDAGFSIWPFDAPALPLVVEIWPRLFMGSLLKSRSDARRRYLAQHLPSVGGAARHDAEASDDAFDALVSAMVMDEHRGDLARLARTTDPRTVLEGEIWRPIGDSPPHWDSAMVTERCRDR
jgi:hypothetical protein